MFGPLWGGTGRHSRTRLRAIATGLIALAVAALLAACGDFLRLQRTDGTYDVKVTEADLPDPPAAGPDLAAAAGDPQHRRKTVPGLTVTSRSRAGRAQTPRCRSASRSRPEVAQPDRPVWVLAATYPRLLGSSDPGGASTSNPQDLRLRPAEARQDDQAVWKLSAVRAGKYTLIYDQRRPRRRSEGPDRRRSRARRLVHGRDQRPTAGNRSHRQRRNR